MPDAVLNVESSLTQSRWVMPVAEPGVVARMIQLHGIPEIIARLLAARNVTPDDVPSFLNPKLGRDFPDPFAMAGMRAMAEDMADAIMAGVPLGIFGDFDVDGATSTAIMVRFFRHLGLDVPFYIPDRMKEGYGPNVGAFETLKAKGVKRIILCDCGITAHKVIEVGRALDLDIIVFDHHEAEEKLPPANHVINPKRKDDTSGLSMLAACGVTFLSCVAINAVLRERGWYASKGLTEPPLKNWLDIVALGTVCDMVPLVGPNRLFTRFGLAQMAVTENAGIRALMNVAGIKTAPTPYHLGFMLGPRINAGSRVHEADLGARLLSTDDAEEAKNISWTLNDCNDQRKDIQAVMFDHAVSLVEDQRLQDEPFIMVGHEDWHPGLSGLVAGRLREKYNKPAVVVTFAPGADMALEGRGSGRSTPQVNMGAAFIDARNAGILVKGGGHAMAAGFTVLPEQIGAFKDFLRDHITRQLDGQVAVSESVIDGVLSVRGATIDFVKLLHDNVGPFGQGYEEPLFVLPSVRLFNVDIVGTDHVRAIVSDWEGGGRLKAVAFRAKGSPLGDTILKHWRDTPFHLVGHFKINEWQGQESVELHIEDAAKAM